MAANERIDRLELLKTFARIIEAGSLSAAARQLNTTQATVSRRLASLENILSVKLLLRNTHSLKLTEDGERCYQQGRILLEQWLCLEDQLKTIRHEPIGLLRVRAPHAFGQAQLLSSIFGFLQQYPQVNIEWLLSDEMPNFLADQVDCALHVGNQLDPNSVAVALAQVPRIVVASPKLLANTDNFAALEQLPWLAINAFYTYNIRLTHTQTGKVQSFAIKPRLFTDNLFVLKNAVMAGVGVAVVSSWLVADEIQTGQLIQLAPEWEAPALPVHLVYPYANYYPERLLAFSTLMKQIVPKINGMRAL